MLEELADQGRDASAAGACGRGSGNVFEKRKAGESKRKLLQFALGYLSTLAKLRKFQADAKRELEENRKSPRDDNK